MLFAIDHGNSAVKTTNFVFTSLSLIHISEPTRRS